MYLTYGFELGPATKRIPEHRGPLIPLLEVNNTVPPTPARTWDFTVHTGPGISLRSCLPKQPADTSQFAYPKSICGQSSFCTVLTALLSTTKKCTCPCPYLLSTTYFRATQLHESHFSVSVDESNSMWSTKWKSNFAQIQLRCGPAHRSRGQMTPINIWVAHSVLLS